MYYTINVSLNGNHFFATAKHSASTKAEGFKIYNAIKQKFPEDEGYYVTCTEVEPETGRLIDFEEETVTIYGLNFNGRQIPDEIARHFASEKRIDGIPRGQRARLGGVCSTENEKNLMLVQASNGRRRLHVVKKMIDGTLWFAIYVY